MRHETNRATTILLGHHTPESAVIRPRFYIFSSRLPSDTQRNEDAKFSRMIREEGLDPVVIGPFVEGWKGMDSVRNARGRGRIAGAIFPGSADLDLAVVKDPGNVQGDINPAARARVEDYLTGKGNMIKVAEEFMGLDIPVGGICLGHQLLALAAGHKVRRVDNRREYGTVKQMLAPTGREHPLTIGLDSEMLVFAGHKDVIWHKDHPLGIFPDEQRLAYTEFDPVLAYTADGKLPPFITEDPNSMVLFTNEVVGTQLHPEIETIWELFDRVQLAHPGDLPNYEQTHLHQQVHDNVGLFNRNVITAAKLGSFQALGELARA